MWISELGEFVTEKFLQCFDVDSTSNLAELMSDLVRIENPELQVVSEDWSRIIVIYTHDRGRRSKYDEGYVRHCYELQQVRVIIGVLSKAVIAWDTYYWDSNVTTLDETKDRSACFLSKFEDQS